MVKLYNQNLFWLVFLLEKTKRTQALPQMNSGVFYIVLFTCSNQRNPPSTVARRSLERRSSDGRSGQAAPHTSHFLAAQVTGGAVFFFLWVSLLFSRVWDFVLLLMCLLLWFWELSQTLQQFSSLSRFDVDLLGVFEALAKIMSFIFWASSFNELSSLGRKRESSDPGVEELFFFF